MEEFNNFTQVAFISLIQCILWQMKPLVNSADHGKYSFYGKHKGGISYLVLLLSFFFSNFRFPLSHTYLISIASYTFSLPPNPSSSSLPKEKSAKKTGRSRRNGQEWGGESGQTSHLMCLPTWHYTFELPNPTLYIVF